MSQTLERITPREREVIDLYTRGYSSQKIARMLYVSPRTVEKHVSNIYTKLGIERQPGGTCRDALIEWNEGR